jgi:hypothetical protein
VIESTKYCRSLHAQISLGTTSDDRFMPNGYVKAFANMAGHVLTEKLDGQNDCLKKEGVFPRSHAAPSAHPWDKPIWDRWQLIKNDLNGLEIFGENMYAIHSIAYSKLESFFYVFAIRENNRWLSWEEVKFYAALLDFPTVPEIEIKISLKEMFKTDIKENLILQNWLTANLEMPWEDSVETEGLLGGYDPLTNKPCSEGFVIRNKDGFMTNDGVIPVAENEFNNLFKLVRGRHVKTDEHWTRNWKPATLISGEKYKWYGYDFVNTKKKEIEFTSTYDIERAKDIGKIVKYSGEYGIVMVINEDNKPSIVVRWDTHKEDDFEQYGQLEYKFIDEYEFKYINMDGTLKK